MQLTNSTLEKTADTLIKLVEESLNNPVEQSIENMNGISNTLINLAKHVNMSETPIKKTVILFIRFRPFFNLFLTVYLNYRSLETL